MSCWVRMTLLCLCYKPACFVSGKHLTMHVFGEYRAQSRATLLKGVEDISVVIYHHVEG